MIVGLHHVAISVPDIDEGIAFYRDVLGFEIIQENEWDGNFELADRAVGLEKTSARMRMLFLGNAYIELWEYRAPKPRDRRAQPPDLGYPHFALQVEGIEAEYQRLQKGGMEFVGPVVDFGKSSAVYGRDPFGNVIEIYEIREGVAPEIPRLP